MVSRIFVLLLIVCFAASPVRAQTGPFVGQWKLIKLTDQMRVTKISAHKYGFDFGGGVETIVIDGTQQPASAGTTLSVAADGPNWKVIRKKGSRVLLTATWSLSKDRKSLKDDFTSFNQDGSPSNVKYVYGRRSEGSGFAGTWVSTAAAVNSVIILHVRPYDRNGLSFISPGRTLNVNFEGTEYSNAVARSALSARRLNERAVEIFQNSKGKITQTRQITLSRDLKTLTMTVRTGGKREPYVYVFDRQ